MSMKPAVEKQIFNWCENLKTCYEKKKYKHCQQHEQYNHLSLQTIARTQKDHNIIMV
jgi:hypothetical protein